MPDADVVIVGAGAAGLSLAHRLAGPRPPGGRRSSVVLVDAPPGPLRPAQRTWCFWEPPGGPYDQALTASWERLRVHGPDGTATLARPAPLRYKMLRSGDFETLVGARLAAAGTVRRVGAEVVDVRDAPGGAEVRGRDAAGRPVVLRARWVFDSRPPRRLPAARTTLLQHFRGWFVRTARPVFDAGTADLMDFRTPAPARTVVRLCAAAGPVRGAGGVHRVLPAGARRPGVRHGAAPLHRRGPGPGRVRDHRAGAGRDPDDRRPVPAPGREVGVPDRSGGRRDPPVHRLHLQRRAAADRRGRRRAGPRPHAAAAAGSPRPLAGHGLGAAARWTAGGSTARSSSPGCSARCPPSGCCASSTAAPGRPRTCSSACAPPYCRCCAPS